MNTHLEGIQVPIKVGVVVLKVMPFPYTSSDPSDFIDLLPL